MAPATVSPSLPAQQGSTHVYVWYMDSFRSHLVNFILPLDVFLMAGWTPSLQVFPFLLGRAGSPLGSFLSRSLFSPPRIPGKRSVGWSQRNHPIKPKDIANVIQLWKHQACLKPLPAGRLPLASQPFCPSICQPDSEQNRTS